MTDLDKVLDRKHTDSVKWDGIMEQYGDSHLIPMWIADMDFKSPKEILDALRNCVDFGIFGYTQCPGRVKTSIEAWLERKYQWAVSDEQIIMNHNVVSSISLAIRALTDIGDHILIHSPVYNPFFEQITQLKRCPVYSQLINTDNRYFMDTEDMEQQIQQNDIKCILICSPHNPGGRIWEPAELEKVVQLSIKYDIPVISDEIHSDLVLYGKTHTPLAKLAGENNAHIVTLMAPTKTFNLAGIGPSYIVSTNSVTVKKIQECQESMVYPEINRFQIEAICTAYDLCQDWLDNLIPYIEKNIVLAKKKLSAISGLNVMNHDASYLMWVNYADLGIEENELEQALIQSGVVLQMGSTYGSAGKGFVRINLAAPQKTVEEGLNRIVQAFELIKSKSQLLK